MEKYTAEQLPELFEGVAEIFVEKKDELCEMDANMGDGDLGLTMEKGYSALPGILRDNTDPGDVGKTLMKSGMKMAGFVPSTMGTLMGSGIMEGGKALKGKDTFGAQELSIYLTAFAAGLQKRGKCQPGDRTILDAVDPAARAAAAAFEAGADMKGVIEAACEGAKAGVEATKDMLPKFGKAAVFSAKAKGIPDQGAVAGMYMIEGLKRGIEK
ncbi:MAG: dihydroxyacetone kinase subunit L [Lachnospiraceae bacterium]|nr:dihydroxyacetone kinase subunit L [Lachnospiraceae bacterium]